MTPRGPGRLRGTATQAARVLRLYVTLRDASVRLGVEDLAALLGVTSRTVRRDLSVLTCAGVRTCVSKIDGTVIVTADAIARSA